MEMSERGATATSAGRSPGRFDKQLLILLCVGAVLVVARSALIESRHSETVDSEYHLNRGIAFLTGTVGKRILNDPPLGEALTALPMWAAGCLPSTSARGLYGHHLRTETILLMIAVWKSLLFLPFLGAVFWWCRKLYGVGAAWLASAILLTEPTFAAHIGLPTVDVLGVEGVVIACVLAWRYFQTPTTRALHLACLAVAISLLLKH